MTTKLGLIEAARYVADWSGDPTTDMGIGRLHVALAALPDDAVIVSRALLLEAIRVIAWYSAQSYPHDAMEGLIERLREAAGKGKP